MATYFFSNDASNPNLAADFGVQQYGVYAGDLWRVKSNLTLNYGIRIDKPHFPDTPHANPLAVSDFGYGTDVVPSPTMYSPRIGFNWDLTGNSDRTQQIRGGIGSFAAAPSCGCRISANTAWTSRHCRWGSRATASRLSPAEQPADTVTTAPPAVRRST